MNKPNTDGSIGVLLSAVVFFLAILSLMIYAFIGITQDSRRANATSNVLVTPTSSSATYVALFPKMMGFIRFAIRII